MWDFIIILMAIINVSVSMFYISSYKVTFKKYLSMLIVVIPIGYIVFSISEFLTTTTVFLAIAVMSYINTHKKGQSFIVSSLCVLNAFIVDGILSNIGVGILKVDMITFMQNNKNVVIYFAISICIQLLISYNVRKLIDNKFQIFKLDVPKTQYGLIVLLLVSSVCIIIYNGNQGKINGLSNEALWISNVILLSYGGVIMGILFFLVRSAQLEQRRQLDKKELEHKQLELKELQVYTTELEFMYEEIRGIRHDFNNILTGMATMIAEKSYNELEHYYSSVLMPLTNDLKQNYYKLGNLCNMKVTEVKGLLAIKLIESNQKNIDFVVELLEPIEEIPIDLVKFCRIVGILVDNAIEEAECCEDPFVRCAFIKGDNELVFIVKNRCRKKDHTAVQIMSKGFSTKGENRGYGLYNMTRMIGSNEHINTIIENVEDEFQVTVIFEF